MDNFLELLVIDTTVQGGKCNWDADFFPRQNFFYLSKADLSSLSSENWLGNYWSLSLCPRMTTGLFLMDPFFFLAVYEVKEQTKIEEKRNEFCSLFSILKILPFSKQMTC